MDFDKDEDEMDIKFNKFMNLVKKMEWSLEEIELNEARMNHIQEELFFAYAHLYNLTCFRDDYDAVMEAEFQELNP